MSGLPPDVDRLISPEELPASVRSIPKNFDPSQEGVLMTHQTGWIKHCRLNDLALCPKGRRTGITFATALDDTITASTQKAAGGDNVYYIGDTKEKGLEFIGYCAHMAKVMSAAMADGWVGIEKTYYVDLLKDGSERNITAYRIRFASGHHIMALSSRPANIRGLQGIVNIDEAAFHQDVQAVIDAASALIIWGGKIRIISTHNGATNPFNLLVRDALRGLNDFKVFEVTFDDAVKNGLYERVCFIKGWEPTKEGKIAWYQRVRGAYTNRAAMLEELDAIPREGSGIAISTILIERSMPKVRPVLRLAKDAEFTTTDPAIREKWCNEWMRENLFPLFDLLPKDRRHSFGMDYARHRDFSVIVPMTTLIDLKRRVPFVIELHNVPTRQQTQILWTLIRALPRFGRGHIDATGTGAGIAEDTADEFGHNVIGQIQINQAWYKHSMQRMVDAFVDDDFDLPRNDNLLSDLKAVEIKDGIPSIPSLRVKDIEDPDLKRHGDFASALGLAHEASLTDVAPIEFRDDSSSGSSEESTGSVFDQPIDEDMSLIPEEMIWEF